MKKIFIIIVILVTFIAAIVFISSYYRHNIPDKSASKVTYTCPMHPQIISDKPGSCPICGMDLVPVKKIEEKENVHNHITHVPEGFEAIHITPEQEKMLGITYETVQMRDIVKEIVTSATVVPNEQMVYKVTVKAAGWVEKLYVNQTGQFVKKGTPLLAIYSPDLYAATQEYISILNSLSQLGNNDSVASVLVDLKKAARDKLRLYDLTDSQIDEIEKTKQAQKLIILYAPYSGYVLEKFVYDGQKVMPYDQLFTIVNLSTLWAEADIYQPDLPYVVVGMRAVFKIPSWGDSQYKGNVSFIYPFVNQQTRTVKVRVVLDNYNLMLKPGMFGEVVLKYVLGKKIAIREQALFKTGEKNYVFIKTNDNIILPREVIVGALGSNGFYHIIKGIKVGDVIMSPANFFIDSESQLKAVFSNIRKTHSH